MEMAITLNYSSNDDFANRELNKLIMNYFVIEGYKDAAEAFSQECGQSPSIDVDSIKDRMNIKNAIQNGNIEEAIEYVNDLNPEASIKFVDELAPLGEENTEFLEELERSMALLAFDNTSTSPVGYLFHTSQRLHTASELNAAILTSQNQQKDPNLPNLLKMLVWAQDELDEEVTYPKMETSTSISNSISNSTINLLYLPI
ncbi:8475_t:CDS:2 [Entrophospora sp. SA101]|nr:8475_t:CDS:2 [Entrophospora sp. SA101]